jgi:hypothetical protein
MIISIQQTLHGYQSGHQLLANSMPLSDDVSKILLFQSDLSGTLSNPNFESYITGYPLITEDIYAFARTWYAAEMKRPGCVWTQTFLIKYMDLGKIPDLIALLPLFERPDSLNYERYNYPIDLEFNSLIKSSERVLNSDINGALYANLYENAGLPVIIPATDPRIFEVDIINLWSNQWPRLRRNFYFCSGSLSLKTIYNKVFDLQVVPVEVAKSISRSETTLFIYDQSNFNNDWLTILRESRKTELRRFLWNFGSDIEGKRNNFITLIRLYQEIYFKNDFEQVNYLIKSGFSGGKQAKNLKSKIYGEDSLITYPESEKEIIKYLVCADDISYLEGITLNLERRLINLLQNDKIQIPELLGIISECPKGRISTDLWDELEITDSMILELLSKNYETAIPLLLRSENILYNSSLWRLPLYQQRQLFIQFYNHNLIRDWSKLTKIALEVSSDIVFDLYWKQGEIVFDASLDWYNQGKINQSFTHAWMNFVTKEKDYLFVKWLHKNEKRIHSKTFGLIFDYLPSKKIVNLSFSHNTWLTAYKKLKVTEYRGNVSYIASLLLAIGFNNDIANSEWLVSVTFQDVYNFAANLKLDQQVYNLIPKDADDNEDNDDWGVFEAILNILKAKPKKQYQVESWDYCENLIRTLCNKTIKNNWNPGAFLSTLKNTQSFYRAVAYCATFKKGRQLIVKIIKHIENKQIQFEPFQYQYLRKIKKVH